VGLIEALVWTVVVEVAFLRPKHGTDVTLVVDQHLVGALGPDVTSISTFRCLSGAKRSSRALTWADAWIFFDGEA
jgi:hypothetical protein